MVPAGPGALCTVAALCMETMFVEATARALALLCDSMPRANWAEHEKRLKRMDCDMTDPALLR